MSNSLLNIGLIGCGHLGSIHCELINQLTKENASLVFKGIYDIDKSKLQKKAHHFSLKAYDSLESLFNETDTLIIATPTSTHYEIAINALKRQKNLFIEKPVTSTASEAKELSSLAAKYTNKIQIGHVERFNAALIALKGYKIEPRFIESHRLAQFQQRGTDVSVIYDLMIHDIDIILSLVKSPIEKIDANGVDIISDNIDIANSRITFKNGCVANLTASRISVKKMRKMRIFQNNAYITIDFLNNVSEVFRLTDLSEPTQKNSPPANIISNLINGKKIIFEKPIITSEEEHNPIKSELESFFNSILNNTQTKVSLEEGLRAIEVADNILHLIKSQNH